jgi:hypothetical protein
MNKEDPVAWFSTSPDGKLSNKFACKPTEGNWVEPLYAAPSKRDYVIDCPRCGHCCPERTWHGLTDEEIQDLSHLAQKIDQSNETWFDRLGFARAIEAKLREKNQ